MFGHSRCPVHAIQLSGGQSTFERERAGAHHISQAPTRWIQSWEGRREMSYDGQVVGLIRFSMLRLITFDDASLKLITLVSPQRQALTRVTQSS